ncbi:MAG: tRNA 2-thiouridine(34) synthase MnmA [Planctomycetota bacterium]|jgi:tRNA-specific 2-thiouridylase
MVRNGSKVLVALSGGVDSSTAAALLVQAGLDCEAVFMITGEQYQSARGAAQSVAKKLAIELHVLDLRAEFERILDYFCGEYSKARTPNPCVVCNRWIKFGRLWDFSRDIGAQFLSTGHYARIIANNGSDFGLYDAADTVKDQSYALSMLDRDVLAHVILPMGDHTKQQTRRMAARFGLGTEQSDESQEICFIPDNDYAAVLERRCPELVRPGEIVDSSGKVLAEHRGVHRFTIGQRRGLGVAMGEPYYVVQIDAETNTVTLGPKEEVMHKRLYASGTNWLIDRPDAEFRARVKIRYNDSGAPATVTLRDGGVVVVFDEPNLAVTPGQLAVFYIEDKGGSRVTGGAWIDRACD